MSGKLVDTNILIYLSKRSLDLEKIASPEDSLFISIITYMEVWGYRFEDDSEKRIIENLSNHLPVIDLNPRIVNKVIAIRQQHKIKLPDAIILATAVVMDLELITANTADFINIDPDLKISNPMI
ncbi:MAG: type II toxin-antitoxin system VapC family toxin [Prolixibacteraceae bacterium]